MADKSEAKPTFRLRMQEFAEKNLKMSFDKMNDVQHSAQMARFYVKEVLRIINNGLVPDDDEDLERCFVDASKDCSVDFISRIENHVMIVQVKYHGRRKPEEEGEFVKFCEVLKKIHPELGSGYKKNEQLRDALADVDWDRDTFMLQFITLGNATDPIRERERQGHVSLHGYPDIDDRTEIRVLDETDLNNALREALSAEADITETVDIRFSQSKDEPPWLSYETSDGKRSYIGRINASQLRLLYDQYRYRLFNLNIRNYAGDTSTNKGIINTAIATPQTFFFFNNGIAAVATKITPRVDDNTLICERFSVINGAQTVRSLAKAHARKPRSAREAEVLARISEVSYKGSETEREFLNSITKYNNTQNAIKISDFTSNDPIQRDLNKKFGELSRRGKTYWYKNKRTGEPARGKIAIGLEEFAKTIHSFEYGPADCFKGTSYLFDTSSDGGYVKVFGDGKEAWTTIQKDDFERLAGIWFLCDQVRYQYENEKVRQINNEDKLIKSTPDIRPVAKSALERRWMLFYTVGELLRAKYEDDGTNLPRSLRRLGDPKWTDDKDPGPEVARIEKYTRAACEILIDVYRAASANPEFAHRNWFRSENTLRDLKQKIRLSSLVLDNLPLLH